MKGLERENARLKKLVADLALLRPAAASATLHAPGAISFRMKASRSALITSAWVSAMPCE
jgi:hypothetical protein